MLGFCGPASAGLLGSQEVTAQFAAENGKPLADAEVRVFAPGDPLHPAATGRSDAAGKFRFAPDRDGLWTAEAHDGARIERVSIRVSGAEREPAFPTYLAIGLGAVLLAIALWYRLLRARARRR